MELFKTFCSEEISENSATLRADAICACSCSTYLPKRDNIICLGFLRQNYGYVNRECHIIGRSLLCGSIQPLCLPRCCWATCPIRRHYFSTVHHRWVCVYVWVLCAVFLSSGWCKKGMICLIPTATRRTKNYFRINRVCEQLRATERRASETKGSWQNYCFSLRKQRSVL
jgi:hypothetical protein